MWWSIPYKTFIITSHVTTVVILSLYTVGGGGAGWVGGGGKMAPPLEANLCGIACQTERMKKMLYI